MTKTKTSRSRKSLNSDNCVTLLFKGKAFSLREIYEFHSK